MFKVSGLFPKVSQLGRRCQGLGKEKDLLGGSLGTILRVHPAPVPYRVEDSNVERGGYGWVSVLPLHFGVGRESSPPSTYGTDLEDTQTSRKSESDLRRVLGS